MEMPEVLQKLIQDFARPRLRPDWRTCKEHEANEVQKHIQEIRLLHKINILDDGWAGHCIVRELDSWTLYGLRKVIREPPGWVARIEHIQPSPLLADWYLHLYKWVVCGDPRWHWVDGVWILEPFV